MANRELGTANKELEAFSSSVSHDLRAPLRAISGFSNILLEDHSAELSDEGRHLLGMMITSARDMNQLIDDLLRLACLGRHTLVKEKVDTFALVNQVIAELRSELVAVPFPRVDRSKASPTVHRNSLFDDAQLVDSLVIRSLNRRPGREWRFNMRGSRGPTRWLFG